MLQGASGPYAPREAVKVVANIKEHWWSKMRYTLSFPDVWAGRYSSSRAHQEASELNADLLEMGLAAIEKIIREGEG